MSVELGAFIAGLSLAQLPYSTELKERMRPATNFFIAVFFASIALQMERGQLLAYWQEALLACAALLVINFAIVFGLFYSQRFDMETSFLGTISMLQVSEFSVVLGALAVNEGFVEEGILGFLSLMALVTMPISTYYVRYNREIFARVEPYLSRFEREDTIEAAPVEYEDHAVIVGYNRFTAELATLLEDTVEDVVVVEDGAEYVEELAEGDHEFIFGNARHGEIRQEANVAEADVLVSVATRDDVNRRLVEETPETISIVRATTEESAQRLRDDGADYVVETAGLVGTELAELLATFDDREAFDQRLAELSERARSETLRANESVEPTAASRDGGRDRTRHRDDDRDRRNDENGVRPMYDVLFALTLIFGIAAVLLVVAAQRSLPVIPFYLLAGILVGVVIDETQLLDLAQWGVAFLVFLFGIHVDLEAVRSTGRISVAVSILQVAVVGGLAVGAGLVFGLDAINAVYLGVAAALSSSLVATSYLDSAADTRPTYARLAESIHFTEDVLGVLIVLSLSAFVYAATPAIEQFAVAGGILALALIIRYAVFHRLTARLRGDSEVMMLVGIAFVVGFIALAEAANLSIVVGAFAAGIAVADDYPH